MFYDRFYVQGSRFKGFKMMVSVGIYSNIPFGSYWKAPILWGEIKPWSSRRAGSHMGWKLGQDSLLI